jgi:hypothetical protein
MQSVRVALAGILAAVVTVSCSGFAERLTANVVAENLLLETGDPFGLAPRQAGVVAHMASITGPLNDPQATPLSGANVTLTVDSASIPVPEGEAGVYQAVSGSGGTPAFVYQSNATYTLTFVVPSGEFADTYTAGVVAPRRTDVTGLPDPLQGEFHPVGTSLTVEIVGSFDRGIVIVIDEGGNVVYDNRPKTPQEAVDFALGSFNGTLTIPGTVFSQANANYGIVVAGLESAPASLISPNLQILTKFYAGSSKTAIVRTQ